MEQNEQIEGDSFWIFYASLKQHVANCTRLGGLWRKHERLTCRPRRLLANSAFVCMWVDLREGNQIQKRWRKKVWCVSSLLHRLSEATLHLLLHLIETLSDAMQTSWEPHIFSSESIKVAFPLICAEIGGMAEKKENKLGEQFQWPFKCILGVI